MINIFCRFLEEEQASALPSVLIMIIIVSLMVGTIMAGTVMQGRFIQNDINAVQARYTAEGAIFQYLSSEQLIVGDSLEVVLPDSHRAVVFAESFGGYLKITSEVKQPGINKKIRVLVGKKADSTFDKAIVLGDIHSKLKLAESTKITGNILTGPLGIKKSNFKGASFDGFVKGQTLTQDSTTFPDFDSKFYRTEIKQFKTMLNQPPQEANVIDGGRYSASKLIKEKKGQTFYATGDIEIFSAKKIQLPETLTVISTGSIEMSGKIQYSSFSKFIAAQSIHIHGNISGNHGLFYAKKKILIEDSVKCSAQFLSGRKITLSDQTNLQYPSVLNVQGIIETDIRRGSINLAGQSVLNGVAMISKEEKNITEDRTNITLSNNSIIRGAIYNAAQTELYGRIFGSVITSQFYFYESPTTYINWIRNSTVNISKRPDRFGVPIGFGSGNSYEILTWREL